MPLKELLEHVVLNSDQLTQLKLKIKQHSTGELSSLEFKQYILQQQMDIVEDLLLLFPIYAKRMGSSETYPQEHNHDRSNEKVERLKQQLQERDELLKDLVPRIMHLEQKIGISSKSVQNTFPKIPELNPEIEITKTD